MNVVALDLSLTATGVATSAGAFTVTSKLTGMARLGEIRGQVVEAARGADLVVIEDYAFSRAAAHSHQLGELGGVVRFSLWEHGWRWVDVNPSSLKRYATGRGNAKKAEVLAEAVRRLGYAGSSFDEADALWLLAMALDHYGAGVVRVPQAHREALVKVPWPALTSVADPALTSVVDTAVAP